MTTRRRDTQDENTRERALSSMFPKTEDLDNRQLAMVGRTPPHMVMHFVRIDLILAAQQWAAQRVKEVFEWESKGKTGSDELVDEEDADFTEKDYQDALEGKGTVNLLQVYTESYHTHMIGRSGAGRDEMLKIFERDLTKTREGEGADRVIMG